jgi:hypothetical protein
MKLSKFLMTKQTAMRNSTPTTTKNTQNNQVGPLKPKSVFAQWKDVTVFGSSCTHVVHKPYVQDDGREHTIVKTLCIKSVGM